MATSANDPTLKLTIDDVRLLSECDTVSDASVDGWFRVQGWKDGKRLVHAHANSRDEVVRLAARHGFRYTDRGLFALSPEERCIDMERFSYRGDHVRRTTSS